MEAVKKLFLGSAIFSLAFFVSILACVCYNNFTNKSVETFVIYLLVVFGLACFLSSCGFVGCVIDGDSKREVDEDGL